MLTNLAVLAQGITNPALNLPYTRGTDFLQDLLPRLIGVAFIIGAVVFLFVMIIGAIQWMTSGGDKAAIETARGKITNALVGIFILFSLFAVFTLVGEFFGINLLQLDLGPLRVGGGGGGGGGGSGCFLAGTKISLADGTYKEIQDIKPGDIVYSYNLKDGKLTESQVASLITHTNYPGGYLVLNNQLKVTGNHNVWVVNRTTWNRADSLTEGDVLLGPDGEISVESIKQVNGENTVYNLSLIGEDHNYFAEKTLVHNVLKQ